MLLIYLFLQQTVRLFLLRLLRTHVLLVFYSSLIDDLYHGLFEIFHFFLFYPSLYHATLIFFSFYLCYDFYLFYFFHSGGHVPSLSTLIFAALSYPDHHFHAVSTSACNPHHQSYA